MEETNFVLPTPHQPKQCPQSLPLSSKQFLKQSLNFSPTTVPNPHDNTLPPPQRTVNNNGSFYSPYLCSLPIFRPVPFTSNISALLLTAPHACVFHQYYSPSNFVPPLLHHTIYLHHTSQLLNLSTLYSSTNFTTHLLQPLYG